MIEENKTTTQGKDAEGGPSDRDGRAKALGHIVKNIQSDLLGNSDVNETDPKQKIASIFYDAPNVKRIHKFKDYMSVGGGGAQAPTKNKGKFVVMESEGNDTPG